jgi:hypothetical protein
MNIYLYNSLLYKKIKMIIKNSTIEKDDTGYKICKKCKKKFINTYFYKNKKIFTEQDIHNYLNHGYIDIVIYENICNLKLDDFDITFIILHTNNSNIMDGLYEEGSNKIYIDNNKNINDSKIQIYSEHFGFIIIKAYKIEKINVLVKNRIDDDDTTIFLPKPNIESFEMKYIFHTHPRGLDYGIRDEYIKLYEFPSISDIVHFIDHHNFGKLIGSLIITPEGLYNIRKYNFNKNKIKIDTDIFIDKFESILYSLDDIINEKYDDYFELDDTKKFFYNNISNNIEFIKIINEELEKYDIAIDYYSRILFKDTDKYIFPNIYLPII